MLKFIIHLIQMFPMWSPIANNHDKLNLKDSCRDGRAFCAWTLLIIAIRAFKSWNTQSWTFIQWVAMTSTFGRNCFGTKERALTRSCLRIECVKQQQGFQIRTPFATVHRGQLHTEHSIWFWMYLPIRYSGDLDSMKTLFVNGVDLLTTYKDGRTVIDLIY